MLIRFTPILFASFFLFACNSDSGKIQDDDLKENTIDSASTAIAALQGDWLYTMGEDSVIESWNKVNDTLCKGMVYSFSVADTTLEELINLRKDANAWTYNPLVFTQNDGKPVQFTLIRTDSVSLHFSNPQHDFPQDIKYMFTGKNTMKAIVSGKIDGKEHRLEIPMQKINSGF